MVAWDDARHWVYEPGSFRPLAQVEDGQLHYIVTDHLGTPRELLSEDGESVAWRAELSLWGRLRLATFHAANDDHAPITCPIRFQGQWEDAETGLYYNRFRYYDPEATQYLSPDPIGLEGGTRPQAYVANPNTWIDPLGLQGCPSEKPSPSAKEPLATVNENLPWGSWNDYPKTERGGRTYAQIGDRLYTRHAVDRMQPSTFGTPAGADGPGRNVSPNIVKHVIRTGTPSSQTVGGINRTVHTSGNVSVVTENNATVIITILRHGLR